MKQIRSPKESAMQSLRDLRRIPGVGKSIANDLYAIGIKKVSALRGKNPEVLYKKSNTHAGVIQDRCLLYVFRTAVYFAETADPKPDLLKWWNWKNTEHPNEKQNKKTAKKISHK